MEKRFGETPENFREQVDGNNPLVRASPKCPLPATKASDGETPGEPDAYPEPSGEDPDVGLMGLVAGGSHAAFSEIVRRHQKLLLNFFARMGASHDGEDLVQETFIRLYRYRESYRPTARFTSFLYHLARNVWADQGRKSMRSGRLAESLRDLAPQAETPGPPRIDRADIEAALDRLSPKLRETLVLTIYQGLRYQEAADALGIPLGTVKSRVNLALNALKEILHED